MSEYIDELRELRDDFIEACHVVALRFEHVPGRVCCGRKYTLAGYEAHCRLVHRVAAGELSDRSALVG